MAEGTGRRPAVQCDGEAYAVGSMSALDQILDRHMVETPADRPRLAELIDETGDGLGMVIGTDVSLLSFVARSGDPPYYVSIGDRRAEGLFVFYVHRGHYSDLPRRHCVSETEVREAMRVFPETGRLADHLEWEE